LAWLGLALLGLAIAIETRHSARIVKRCDRSSVCAIVSTWLVTPCELHPLAALVNLQGKGVRDDGSLDEAFVGYDGFHCVCFLRVYFAASTAFQYVR